MRIINSTLDHLQFTDFDRGNAGESRGIYESWNAKAHNGVGAGDFIDIQDTEDVLLSAELGQIKKYKDAGWIDTLASMVSEGHTTFTIVGGVNDTLDFTLASSGAQTVTFSAGEISAADIVLAINSAVSVSGFTAEVVTFFRSSNQDDVIEGSTTEGWLGTGVGQRTEAIIDNFIALVADEQITIDGGNANATLGFHEKNFTKVL